MVAMRQLSSFKRVFSYPAATFSAFHPGVVLKIDRKVSAHVLPQAIANANGVASFISLLIPPVHTVSVSVFQSCGSLGSSSARHVLLRSERNGEKSRFSACSFKCQKYSKQSQWYTFPRCNENYEMSTEMFYCSTIGNANEII